MRLKDLTREIYADLSRKFPPARRRKSIFWSGIPTRQEYLEERAVETVPEISRLIAQFGPDADVAWVFLNVGMSYLPKQVFEKAMRERRGA